MVVPWLFLIPRAYNIAFTISLAAISVSEDECCLVLKEITFHLCEYGLEGNKLSLLSVDEGSDVKLPLDPLFRLSIFVAVAAPQTTTLEQEVAELHLKIDTGQLSLAHILQIFVVIAISFILPTAIVSITLFLEYFFDEHV